MDFVAVPPTDIPKRSYQCLATISLGSNVDRRRSSFGSDTGSDNGLTRILSGGRRKSQSNGATETHHTGADHGLTRILSGGRRKSVQGAEDEGTWYWRCRAGVTADNLIILPIANPPNPVLRARPPPLSTIVHPARRLSGHTFMSDELEGERREQHRDRDRPLQMQGGGAIAGFGRRLSAAIIHPKAAGGALGSGGVPEETAPRAGGGVISNTAATADTGDIPTETGFPGTVEGVPLGAVVVPLNHVRQGVKMGGKDKEGCHVSVGVASAVAGKSGHIRFEFDREYLGGKAEAELLLHNIQQALANASPVFDHVQLGGAGDKYGADKEYNANWKQDLRGRW